MAYMRYLGASMIFVILGCHSMPSVTRSGEVKDIVIADKVSSGELAVGPGDEVRWINKRAAPVRVIFLDSLTDKQLSCKHNFGGWMTPSDTARLDTNETASACFRDPGYVRYTVRMESAMPNGELNAPGVIKVGSMSGSTRTDEMHSTVTTTTTTISSPAK
ncbi:MAG TPA: hypothetical protein VJ746_20740 [Nitrospira sp.]|nr:hypothetical protein [Nitrospira sp.]